MKMNKKGVVENLVPLVIGLVVVGVVLAIGFLILSNIASNDALGFAAEAANGCNRTSVDACSAAYNGTATTITAMAGIPGWLGVIIIVVIGALLIGLVSMFRQQQ